MNAPSYRRRKLQQRLAQRRWLITVFDACLHIQDEAARVTFFNMMVQK